MPSNWHIGIVAIRKPRFCLLLTALEAEVTNMLRRRDRKPVGEQLFLSLNYEAPALFTRVDDSGQCFGVWRRALWYSSVLKSLKKLLEAVVPVGMRVDDMIAQKFRRRFAEVNSAAANRNHELRVRNPFPDGLTDGAFFLHPILSNICGDD